MKETAEQALLRAIIENEWAEPESKKYGQKLRESDPEIRRLLGAGHPKLAEAHIVARYNENFVHEFSQLPKQVVEALIQFLVITTQLDRTFVHLVTHEPDASMFPTNNRSTEEQGTQRIAFITPSSIDLATHTGRLFLGHHSRYRLDGLAIELVTQDSTIGTRLHLKVAAWTQEGRHFPHQFGIITVETDGSVSYKRFTLELDVRFVAEACFGVKPKESLVDSRPMPTQLGGDTDLDTLFPGAKGKLAEDLPHLPGFIIEVAEKLTRPMRIPGF